MAKFRRFVRKNKIFSSIVLMLILALGLSLLNKTGLSNAILIIAAVIGVSYACVKSYETMQHGYFGIMLLPIVGIVAALFIKDFWVGGLFALLIGIERPLLSLIQSRSKPSVGKPVGLNTVRHAPLVRYLDKASLPFMILVILIGGGVWIASGELTRFVEVIAIASTAPLLIVAPICFLVGMSKLTGQNVILRSAVMFEALASARALFAKKTGIITSSEMSVSKVTALNKHTKDEVIKVAASLAASSSHPTAQAITKYATENLHINKAKHVDEVSGMGIAGRMKGADLVIGRLSFLEQRGVTLPNSLPKVADTVVYVAINDVLIGYITFNETLLSGTKKLSKSLRGLGVKSISLVSGSSQASTVAIAKQVGISDAHGDMQPGDVIRLIENSKDRPVVFVGNTATDAAILPVSDVAITADEELSSHVSINDYSIDKLITTFQVSKKCLSKTFRLSLIGLSVVLIFIVVAASGVLTPIQAVTANLLVTLFAILLSGFTSSLKV